VGEGEGERKQLGSLISSKTHDQRRNTTGCS